MKETYKYKLYLFLILIFLFVQSNSYSQSNVGDSTKIKTDSTNVNSNDSLLIGRPRSGFAYSQISSFGYTFQNSIFDFLRYSFTFNLPIWDEYSSIWDLDINYALQLQKPIIGNNANYLFVFAGGGITDYTFSEFTDLDGLINDEAIQSYGIGIGASLSLFDNISIDLEIGYGFAQTFNEVRDENQIIDGFASNYKTETSKRVGTTFGIGIYRRF